MFGLDTKRCSIAGTDLQPAPPKTARNKTNPKNSLPKRIPQLQRIANPLSTPKCRQSVENGKWRRKDSAILRAYGAVFLVWKIQRRTKRFAFSLSWPAFFRFSNRSPDGNGGLKNLNLFPPARAAVPKFPDAADCRCSNAFALAASGQSNLPASRIPHARPRKPY